MGPLIFLDIDGVMNSLAWMMSAGRPMKNAMGYSHFDPSAVDCLSRIVRWTDAQVVVASSAWDLDESETLSAAMQSEHQAGLEGTS